MLNYVQTLQGQKRVLDSVNQVQLNRSYTFRDGPVTDGLFWAIVDTHSNIVATDLAPAHWRVTATGLVQSSLGGPGYFTTQHLTVTVPKDTAPAYYDLHFYYSGPVTLLDGSTTTVSYVTPIYTDPTDPTSAYSYGRNWGSFPGLQLIVCSDWTISSTDPQWNASTNTLTLKYDPRTAPPSAALTFSLVSQVPPTIPYSQGLPTPAAGQGFYDIGVYDGPFTGTGNPPPYEYLLSSPVPGPYGLRQTYKILILRVSPDMTGNGFGATDTFAFFHFDRTFGIPVSATLTSETVIVSPNQYTSYPLGATQRSIVSDVYVGHPASTSNPYVPNTQGGFFLLDKFILIHLVMILPPGTPKVNKKDKGDQMDMAQDHASGLITIIRSVKSA